MDVDTDGKASDGDGRRRRSFLPAPKKTTSLAFASSQTSLTDDAPLSHSSSIPLASSVHSSQAPPSNLFSWKAPSSSGSVVEQARTQPARSHGHGDRMRSGRHPARHSFGVGLYVGARVKIGGVKPGILRYLGPTHFAHGTFCGIELLDEDGNHDGKVNGHRYFVCAPNHGIFAPDEKVILDTSSVSGRVSVESEDWFTGAERASRVSRSHEQGQHESTDRSKHGQNLGPHRSKHTDESAYSRHSGDARLPAYANLNASYTSGMPLESMDAHSFSEASKRGVKSERSRSSRSILEAAHPQRQHPSQPYSNSKRGDLSVNYQRSSSCSSQSDASLESSLEATDKNRNSSSDFESEQEHGRLLRRHARPSDRASDGFRTDSSGRYALSTGVKEQLRSDSKQYLNFTFDRDDLNRSMDSDGFERGGTFDYQDFSMAANCGGSSSVHFPHGPSLDKLSHEGLDFYLAGQATHSCSERLDGAKREGTGLSRSGASHRSGGNSGGPSVNSGDSGVYSMTARCPLCNSSLSKEMVSSGSHVCEFGTSFTDADTEDEEDEEDDQQQSGTNEAVLGTKAASAGTNDEDEDSSEPTGNTEDERIEADQSTGQDPTIAALAAALGEILKSQSSNKPRDANKGQQDQELDSCLVSTGSGSKEDDQSPNKDEANSTAKARRAVKITRKRSENIDHKMPNINVTSRLADYIKAPVPVKTKEEKENELNKKQNKNVKNGSNNRSNLNTVSQSMLNLATSRASSLDEGSYRTRVERPEVPKPIIKKTPRKNKWDNIMSQIEANKDKPKPVTEVKSSLAAYLNAPPPQDAETDQPPRLHRKEAKSKIKELPPPPPKIDFSKIKSKLNVPTAASAIKSMPKREPTTKARKANLGSKDKSPLPSPVTPTREGMVHDRRVSEGSVALELHSIREEDGSVRTSPTEFSEGDNSGQAPAEQGGVSSKKGPDPSQKENRRPSSAGGKSDSGDKIQEAHESATHSEKSAASLEQQLNSSTEKQINDTNHGTKADESNTREDTTDVDNTLNQHDEMSPSAAQLEHELLESLCEARAQVAGLSKMQLDLTSQAFDAMRALFRTFNKELKTLKCPSLLQKLDTALKQLDSYVSQTANLSSQRDSLNKHFTEVLLEQKEAVHRARAAQDSADKESNERLTNELNDSHRATLSAQKEELSAKHEDNITSLTHFYERQIELLRQSNDRQVADITNEGKLEINSLKICHLEEVQGLRNKHEGQMEDLHQQHRNKMEDMTQRFESVKLSHSEKVESLRKECEELAQRARNSEEALQKDADVKVQMALAPYLSLPSEIESLKSVQEMRIEEIQKLRVKIVDLEKQLEELPIATEKIISLQQKIENLGAIISIKTEREKQLHEKCQVLMRKYDRESRANKRISMDFEQVMWRMTQSSDFGSCESLKNQQHSRSPSRGQDETRHASFHKMSPGGRHGDVVLRVRKRSSDSISDSDRKLRSKSASFLIERNEGGNNSSPSLSPKLKQKKRSKKSPTVEISVDRMFHSAGPEFMSHLLADPSHKQKEWNRPNETTDLTTSQETSTSNMATSYARSNSGISDSGVYDSMTRSDQLNTSVASTDSEWGHSGNILVTSDRKMGDDGSGPPAGDYNCLSDGTVSDS